MKKHFKKNSRTRPILASALAVLIFLLPLAACQGTGEPAAAGPVIAGAFSSVPGTPSAAPSGGSASSRRAASSAASSAPVSSAPAPPSSAPVSKPPVSAGKNDIQAVKKIDVPEGAVQTRSLSVFGAEAPQSAYQKIDQRGGYGALTTQGEKDLYERIGKSVYQVSQTKNSMGYYPLQTVEVPPGLNEARICETLVAYQDDNPQVFWVANSYSIGTKGNNTYLQLYSNLSPEQCNTFNQKFTQLITAAMRAVPSGLNEFGREEAIFNYIVGRCSYDHAAASDPGLWQSYTAYGALVNGKAVCEGYSRAMQLLCSYAGLQCVLIRGTAEGGNHMWNCIDIDNLWYQLDVTWCDNTELIYNYFNITDQALGATHTPAAAVSSMSDDQICNAAGFYNLVTPLCNSTIANYYLVRGIRVGDPGGLDGDAVVKAMAEQIKSGRKTIVFAVGSYSDFGTESKALLHKLPSYLKAAAGEAGKALNLSSVNYLTDEPNRGVNIIVPYAGKG